MLLNMLDVLSRQIATLELEAGTRLVDRSARWVLRRVAEEHCFACDACVA